MNTDEKPESVYALGLILQALKFIHEEYASDIKGSSVHLALFTRELSKISVVCQLDMQRMDQMVNKYKGNQPEGAIYSPYYNAVDFVKEMIETTMKLATMEDARFAIDAGRDILRHIQKEVETKPKPKRTTKKAVHPVSGRVD